MVYEVLHAAQFRVKYKDFFHMKKLYIMLHEWLVEFGWCTREDSSFPEVFYLQREHQKRGTELWIWWRMKKKIEGASYWSWTMDIDWHIILLKDTQVMHKGVKYDTNWGEVEITIDADLVMDPQKEWDKNWFLKHVNDMFRGRMFKAELEKHKIELYRETYRFQEAIKSYLSMKTYLPEPEAEAHFFPATGVGEPEGIR